MRVSRAENADVDEAYAIPKMEPPVVEHINWLAEDVLEESTQDEKTGGLDKEVVEKTLVGVANEDESGRVL